MAHGHQREAWLLHLVSGGTCALHSISSSEVPGHWAASGCALAASAARLSVRFGCCLLTHGVCGEVYEEFPRLCLLTFPPCVRVGLTQGLEKMRLYEILSVTGRRVSPSWAWGNGAERTGRVRWGCLGRAGACPPSSCEVPSLPLGRGFLSSLLTFLLLAKPPRGLGLSRGPAQAAPLLRPARGWACRPDVCLSPHENPCFPVPQPPALAPGLKSTCQIQPVTRWVGRGMVLSQQGDA